MAAGSGKPRRGRANLTCWTCDKVGHYSYECEESSESDDDSKDEEKASKDDVTATAVTIESDKEFGGAWAAEVSMMDNNGKPIVEKIPTQDWFDVVEGENESGDEGANLKDAEVDGFDRDASQAAQGLEYHQPRFTRL